MRLRGSNKIEMRRLHLLLLRQVSGQIVGAMKDFKLRRGIKKTPSGALNFNPGRAIRDSLRVLLGSKDLDIVVAALDYLESDVRSSKYENIFSTMTNANDNDGKMYTADDFMLVWAGCSIQQSYFTLGGASNVRKRRRRCERQQYKEMDAAFYALRLSSGYSRS